MYKQKYLKYKNKYFNLKQNGGGTLYIINSRQIETLKDIDDNLIKTIPTKSTSDIGPYSIIKHKDTYRVEKDGVDYGDNYKFELTHKPKESQMLVQPYVSKESQMLVQPYVSKESLVLVQLPDDKESPILAESHVHQLYEQPRRIEIIGSHYIPGDNTTNFSLMINEPQYKNTLFIFNDNVLDHLTNNSGGGNAYIRKYNRHRTDGKNPQSAGISTGLSSAQGGFRSLDDKIKEIINNEIQEIKELISQYRYDKIIWSQNKYTGQIGADIFKDTMGQDVIKYITEQIISLGELVI